MAKQLRWVGFMALTCLLALGAQASVNEVEVIADVRGESPLDAQEKAIDYAQKRAFFLTLSKLAPAKALAIAESLASQQILAHIRGYELLEDRQFPDEPNRYLAKYKVSVSEDMVQRLLSSEDGLGATDNNPILLLPVLIDGDRVLLWEDNNIWRSIWNSVALEQGENLIIMPYGDPKDAFITDSTSILNYDFRQLAELAGRYGAGEVVVAVAQYERERNPKGLNVLLRRYGPDLSKTKPIYFETDDRHETPESVLPIAARNIAEQLTEIAKNYQGETLKRMANANKTQIRAQFRRINDWATMQQQLRTLPRVLKLDVGSISIQTADATLFYDGTPEMMQEVMRANGLYVRPEGAAWMVAIP